MLSCKLHALTDVSPARCPQPPPCAVGSLRGVQGRDGGQWPGFFWGLVIGYQLALSSYAFGKHAAHFVHHHLLHEQAPDKQAATDAAAEEPVEDLEERQEGAFWPVIAWLALEQPATLGEAACMNTCAGWHTQVILLRFKACMRNALSARRLGGAVCIASTQRSSRAEPRHCCSCGQRCWGCSQARCGLRSCSGGRPAQVRAMWPLPLQLDLLCEHAIGLADIAPALLTMQDSACRSARPCRAGCTGLSRL